MYSSALLNRFCFLSLQCRSRAGSGQNTFAKTALISETEVCAIIPGARSWTVLAPSITPGPSLKEKVDASDQDHMLKSIALPMALAVKEICWADGINVLFIAITNLSTGWIWWFLMLLMQLRKDESNGTSPPNDFARLHLYRVVL